MFMTVEEWQWVYTKKSFFILFEPKSLISLSHFDIHLRVLLMFILIEGIKKIKQQYLKRQL